MSRGAAKTPDGLPNVATPKAEEYIITRSSRDASSRSKRSGRKESWKSSNKDKDEVRERRRSKRKESARRERSGKSRRDSNSRDKKNHRHRDSRDRKSKKSKKKERPGQEHFAEPHITSRYKFVRYLGHGSYGHVCEARCLRTGQRVAIKKVPKIFNNEIDAKRLLRELRILRALRHHEAIINVVNIIPPPDILKFNVLSIVFEFVDTDLSKLIASEQYFSTLHVQYMLYQLLLGIKYMHSANIAHRDLKPANILVNEDCSLKICDFGLSRGVSENFKQPKPDSRAYLPEQKEDDEKDKKSNGKKDKSRQLTRHVVTRWYRAPEIILLQQERELLPAVDMWAVGCIFSELLQMLQETCRSSHDRKPLFPGTSCFPLSAKDPFAYNDRKDQLNVIFEVLGTPSKSEINELKNEKAQKYLLNLPKRNPIDWRKKFPGCSANAIHLLKGLLQFNSRKRLTVDQALAHPFMRSVRDEEAEVRHKKVNFDFEDIPLKIRTIKELIIDEIMIWNPRVKEKLATNSPTYEKKEQVNEEKGLESRK